MMNLLAILLGWVIGRTLKVVPYTAPPASQPAGPRYPPTPTRPRGPIRPTAQPAPTPRGSTVPASTTLTAPQWPQVTPSGLPPFPGSGWVPDEPPPAAVVSRAQALLPALWASGEGTFKIEKTAGRWIAFRATNMGGKRGVVAYRLRDPASATSTAATTPTVTPGPTLLDTSSSSTTALPTLRRGSRGSEVEILQKRLGITADGIFGPGTEAAVKAYQRSKGLTADGVVGPNTWRALFGGGT